MAKFNVIRDHLGDRHYHEGEIREGELAEFKHLIPHVLRPLEGSNEKAESPLLNKAEFAPANKATTGRKAIKRADEPNGEE